jgi:hypothetical protein
MLVATIFSLPLNRILSDFSRDSLVNGKPGVAKRAPTRTTFWARVSPA